MKKRSKHSLSFQRLQSMNMGYLYPTGVVEVLPGDSMRIAQSAFCRFSPLVNPVMAKISVMMYRFYIPFRTLDNNFETVITGGISNDTSLITPQIQLDKNSWKQGGLFDYLGIGNPGENTISVNAYAARAYNLVWNEFFRDEDLMTEAYFDKDAAIDDPANYGILPVCWEKDYFTIARPWQLKGDAVSIPVQGAAEGNMPFSGSVSVTGNVVPSIVNTGGITAEAKTGSNTVVFSTGGASGQHLGFNPVNSSGTAQGTIQMTATGFISPEDLRLAMSLQRFGENRARFGSRISEYLRYLGVRPQDSRLQLPEYLGGGLSTMQLSEVIQTAPSEGASLGTLAGHGIGVARSRRSRHFFPEHGIVLFLACLRPKAIYANSVPRTFLRKTRFDFWQPELQNLGQQEITNQELNASNNNPSEVFGYSDRYNEYRFNQSQVCGEFRSVLQDWHLGRILPNNTTLNADFVRCQPRTDIFAVTAQDYDKVYCSFSHSIQARRLVSRFAKPSLR